MGDTFGPIYYYVIGTHAACYDSINIYVHANGRYTTGAVNVVYDYGLRLRPRLSYYGLYFNMWVIEDDPDNPGRLALWQHADADTVQIRAPV